MSSPLDYTAAQTFAKGDRVELHPGLDLWMRGAKYATVLGPGSRGQVRIQVDATGWTVVVPVDRLRHISGDAQ